MNNNNNLLFYSTLIIRINDENLIDFVQRRIPLYLQYLERMDSHIVLPHVETLDIAADVSSAMADLDRLYLDYHNERDTTPSLIYAQILRILFHRRNREWLGLDSLPNQESRRPVGTQYVGNPENGVELQVLDYAAPFRFAEIQTLIHLAFLFLRTVRAHMRSNIYPIFLPRDFIIIREGMFHVYGDRIERYLFLFRQWNHTATLLTYPQPPPQFQGLNESDMYFHPVPEPGFPPVNYRGPFIGNNRANSDDTENQCSICMEPFTRGVPGGNARLACGHEFHTDCINRWTAAQEGPVINCPMCRRPISGLRAA